ncbi:MAG: hypothetical protein K0Q87_1122 [Neobacillus sp.]|jgi:hypothetical protein|nr:hypothetical protein [Neobacillus sp.]
MDEGFQDKVDRFWERVLHPFSNGKTKLFNDKGGWFYYGMGAATILVALFLLVNILSYQKTHIEDSGIGNKSLLTLQSVDLNIISEMYNPKNNYAQILISASNSDDNGSLYKVESIVSELSSRAQLKSKLVQVTDQYYVLKIYNLPDDFEQVVIDIGVFNLDNNEQVSDVDLSNLLTSSAKNSNSNSGDNFEQGTWKLSGVHMKKTSIRPEPKDYYTILYTKLEQENAYKIINNINKVILSDKESSAKLQRQIKSLKESERYQTDEEIKNTEDNISNLKSSVSQIEDGIKDQMTLKNQLEDKIEKLELQRSDAKKELEKGKVPNE